MTSRTRRGVSRLLQLIEPRPLSRIEKAMTRDALQYQPFTLDGREVWSHEMCERQREEEKALIARALASRK